MKPPTGAPDYSVVVPVYESDRTVVELVDRVQRVFERELGADHEVILVDDGSPSPTTWSTCRDLATDRPNVLAIRLMRNYGKANAVLCGLEHVRGRYVITIDDDLQQRPEDIPVLIENRDHDVVVANFENRRDGMLLGLASRIKRFFDRAILGVPCAMSPLKLFTADVARGMLGIRTPYPFIPAMMAHVTNDFHPVIVEHDPSLHGKSRYSWRRRFSQFSNLLISNSTLLLRGLGAVGAAVSVAGFVFALTVVVRRLLGVPILPGWASLVVVNLVFGGLILIALGIVGEYLLRILEGISFRPPYVTREKVGLHGTDTDGL